MVDGVVQVPAGFLNVPTKTIDVSELTRADGSLAERQRVAFGDPNDVSQFAQVVLNRLQVQEDFLRLIHLELVRIRFANAKMSDLDLSAITEPIG